MKTKIKACIHKIFGEKFAHGLQRLYQKMKPAKTPKEESMFMKTLSHYIQPGTNVIDIGANVGTWTRYLSEIVGPKGKVIAFEPIPESFQCLQKHLKKYKNVQLMNLALSDSNQIKDFLVNPSSFAPLDSAIKETAHQIRNIENYKLVQIASRKLDDVLRENPIGKISFIKCDVEGHEDKVIAGAESTIQNDKPFIFMEILREKWKQNDPTLSESASILLEGGYKMGQITEKGILFNKCDFEVRNENFFFSPLSPDIA